jgi:tetratricopeptide (TPR) repeat protein
MRSLRSSGLLLALAALALSWAPLLKGQDWRGSGRVDGWVKDQSGQPVADATVQLSREKGGGPSTKTNKKGYWAVLGLIGGSWNVDVTAQGYAPRKLTVSISEANRIPPMDIRLEPTVAPVAQAPGRDIAGEVTAAVNQGNKLLGEKKFAEARAEYEKALAVVPDNAALWKGIAQTYHGEGNKAKVEESLRKVVQIDPSDTDSQILLADDLIDEGKIDEGKAILDALPAGAVKDPAVYSNLAIVFMNKKRPEDALVYMTKAIAIDATLPDSYYYRGLANIQAKKNAEAKADFLKYMELAPNGPEAKEVKEMLQALK